MNRHWWDSKSGPIVPLLAQCETRHMLYRLSYAGLVEFSPNDTKMATLATKIYVGKSKINLVKNVNLIRDWTWDLLGWILDFDDLTEINRAWLCKDSKSLSLKLWTDGVAAVAASLKFWRLDWRLRIWDQFWRVTMYFNGTLPLPLTLDAPLDARCVYTLTTNAKLTSLPTPPTLYN